MVFISRNLSSSSPLLTWGREHEITVKGKSLLKFAAVPFVAPEAVDWWFFYSSRAVVFAGPPPPGVRLAAFGTGTAAALEESGKEADFVGSGDPENVAKGFAEVAGGQRVFFPRARQSRKSVQTAIADRVTVLDAICYDNLPDPPATPIEAKVYIFTSPLNVSAYLDHHPPSPAARFLAIGPSTAAALRARGFEPEVSSQPTEVGLVSLLSL